MEKFDIVIKNGTILTMNKKEEIVEEGWIGIKGERIVSIKKGNIKAKGKKEIDAKGCIVIPGFINSHTHIAMVFFRGIADDIPLESWLKEYIWPLEAKFVTREWVEDASRLSIAEMIRSGTTTFVDMYFYEDVTANVAKKAGIRAILGEGILKFPSPSFKKSDEVFPFIKDFITKWKNDSLIYPAMAPHAIYSTSKDQLKKAFEWAEEHDIPYFLHVSETKKEVDDFKREYGKSPVEFLDSLGVLKKRTVLVHGVWLNEEDTKVVKEREAGIVHNPQSNLKLGSGIAPVDKWLKEKVKVGLGTDSAASNNNLDMLAEIRTCALIHKGIKENPKVVSAQEVLRMATIQGAKLWGLEKEIGSIEEGKKADIIILNKTNLHNIPSYNPYSTVVYSAKSQDVKTVIINGRIVMENYKLLTLDEKEIKERTTYWRKKIQK